MGRFSNKNRRLGGFKKEAQKCFRFFQLSFFSAFLLFVLVSLSEGHGEELTSIAQVRALTLEEASQNYPVRIIGTVVYFDSARGYAFVHDGEYSIFFRPGKQGVKGQVLLDVGEVIEVIGVTVSGSYSPSIAGIPEGTGNTRKRVPVQIRRLGKGALPQPIPVKASDLESGEFHDQYLQVEMTIRYATNDLNEEVEECNLGLNGLNASYTEATMKGHIPEIDIIKDVPARFVGILASSGDDRGRLIQPRLLVNSPEDVTLYLDELDAIFRSPPITWNKVFGYHPRTGKPLSDRVKVQGTVTVERISEELYISNGRNGLRVQSPQWIKFSPGSLVEVVGIPAAQGNTRFLGDAIVKLKGKGSVLSARKVEMEEALSGTYEGSLISIEGILVEKINQQGVMTLFLMEEGTRFAFRLSHDSRNLKFPELGSRLRVTGVHQLPPSGPLMGPPLATFMLLARNHDDITVLQDPPLLTLNRTRWVLAGMGIALLVGVLILAILRRQVTQQSELIAVQVEQQAITGERQRMARELHDTLEQHLAGVQIQLDAVDAWSESAPSNVRRAVANARAMLEHSREETRQSVFELRSQSLEELGLVGALKYHATRILPNLRPAIRIKQEGNEEFMPSRIRFHVLRIAQEAISNTIRHSKAEEVVVTFRFSKEQLCLTVQDNGQGFDDSKPAIDPRPRFGLRGIKERAEKIHADLSIDSEPNRGTTITLTLPYEKIDHE